jgi:hypothetical protein
MKSQTNTHVTKETGSIVDAESYAKSPSGNRNTITRDINNCLAPCDECTGLYIDSIRGDILRIICHHQCHFDTKYKPGVNPKQIDKDAIPDEHLKECSIRRRSNCGFRGSNIFLRHKPH